MGEAVRNQRRVVLRPEEGGKLAEKLTETLGIGGAKLPNMPEGMTDPRARLEERATQIRHLIETLDLLYDAFGQQRLSKEWAETLPKMQKWLTREERRAA